MSEHSPVAFYFTLNLPGMPDANALSFFEVSGISTEAPEEFSEGGENKFKHKLPAVSSHSNLVLKRGAGSPASAIMQWCADTINGGTLKPIVSKTIVICLMDNTGIAVKTWTFVNACPVGWKMSEFNGVNGNYIIETLEFSYSYSEVK